MLFHLPAHPDGAPQIVPLRRIERIRPSRGILLLDRVNCGVKVLKVLAVSCAGRGAFAKGALIYLDSEPPSRLAFSFSSLS